MAVILITGCSTGIGYSAALEFAGHGDTVYATMRNTGKAGDLASTPNVHVLELEVTDQASVDACIAEILDRSGRVDVLVNNAGIDNLASFEDAYEEEVRSIIETNFFGAWRVTRAVLPTMREQRSGAIVMVTSLAALAPTPGEAAYAASKCGLEGAAEVLSHEVARFGIRVCVVEPGFTRTPIGDKVDPRTASPADSPYRAFMDYLHRQQGKDLDGGDDPRMVAEAIREAVVGPERFRHPVGEMAKMVYETKRTVSEQEMTALVRDELGLGWWIDGDDAPPAD